MKKRTKPHDFVGKFFFSFKNDELQWQGQIINKVSERSVKASFWCNCTSGQKENRAIRSSSQCRT